MIARPIRKDTRNPKCHPKNYTIRDPCPKERADKEILQSVEDEGGSEKIE
jgi:hypothetical protein